MKVAKIFQWDAAHQLCLPYESKCNHMHGHTYKVEIEMEGNLNDEGMVIDFKDLKKWVEGVSFDHTLLNEIPAFADKNPTAEYLVKYLHDELEARRDKGLPYIHRIRVWETPTSYAEETWDVSIAVLEKSRRLMHKYIEEDTERKAQTQKTLQESIAKLEEISQKLKGK